MEYFYVAKFAFLSSLAIYFPMEATELIEVVGILGTKIVYSPVQSLIRGLLWMVD